MKGEDIKAYLEKGPNFRLAFVLDEEIDMECAVKERGFYHKIRNLAFFLREGYFFFREDLEVIKAQEFEELTWEEIIEELFLGIQGL